MFYTYLVYNTILIFTVVFSILVEKSRDKLSEYGFRCLLFITQALPASLRFGIGTDYWNYVELYKLYHRTSDSHEIGFQALANLLIFFEAHYHIFIVVLSILAIAPICFYVPKKHFHYFIIIYFFMSYLDIIGASRQDISVAFVTCGIFVLYSYRGTLKYLIASFLAFLMHYSSFLYFPLIIFKNIILSTKKVYVLLVLTFVLTAGAGLIEWLFNSALFQDSPYGVYIGSKYVSEAKVGSGLGILANLLIALLFLLLYHKSSRYIEHSGFFSVLALLFVGSYLLASQIHILGRLVNIFLFVPAFLAYPTCKAISSKYPSLIFLGFFFIYLLIFENSIANNQIALGSGLGISPYISIFD